MIILKFKKGIEAIIQDSGVIDYWPEISNDIEKEWQFVGLAKSKYGDYSFTKNEMLKHKITTNEQDFYPVICDCCNNFAIVSNKILEIKYDKN